MYPSTYNFKDEADGTSGTDIDFVDSATVGANTTAQIIASLDGHRKVLELHDNDGGALVSVYNNFSAQTSGTIDLLIRTSDATPHTFIQLFQSGALKLQFAIRLENLYYNDAGPWVFISPISDNMWYHFKLVFDCATDTFDFYVNDDLKVTGIDFFAVADNITRLQFNSATANNGYYSYFDTVGYSWDPAYKIGDNIFWRHYKESTDSFEGDDVGTQGTSITWVDNVNQVDDHEIVAEFNEHKKVLRTYQNSGTGDCYHIFAAQSTVGWVAKWVKVADADAINGIIHLAEDANLRIKVQIDNDRFEYDAGAGMVTAGVAAVDATWYLVYLQWYVDNTFDLWVNNVQYLDGVSTFANFTSSGVNRWYIDQDTVGAKYIYTNAPISSLDGDSRADNRTFDYLPYTYNDVTSNVVKCEVAEVEYEPSTAIIHDDTQLSITDLHIIQLYDENSDLRFEGLKIDHDAPGVQNIYYLKSLNNGELNGQISYTASSAGDVNSHLLAIHTNVGQADGRLIYYQEDDPAGDITPNYKNRPTKDANRWLATHGNKILINKPNGVCFLDDDRNPSAGATTITEASTSLLSPPLSLHTITNQINRVEIDGAININTGTPFNGVSEDTTAQTDGTGVLKYYKRFRELQSDIDCENRAISIRTGSGFSPQLLTIKLKSIYALPGEIINFAYSDRSFSATNCFVEAAVYNLVQGLCTYTINTGIFDAIGMGQPQFTYAGEGTNTDSAGIYDQAVKFEQYEFDINTIYLRVEASTGVTTLGLPFISAFGDYFVAHAYISDKIAVSKDIVYNWILKREGALGWPTINMKSASGHAACDGSTNINYTNIENDAAGNITIDANQDTLNVTKTITGGTVAADEILSLRYKHNDGDAAGITCLGIEVVYFVKRG